MAATPRLWRRPLAGQRLLAPAIAVSAGWGPRAALSGVLALAAALECFHLDQEGYGNLYYAAGVRSMLEGWHNLFYAAFDPGGFVTLDKPPLGFWLQAASARLLGFSGLSLLLPQALAAVLAVALLYYLVRRAFGPLAGLLAALFLALTPISVATGRSNTVDSLLALVVLVAAWAALRAVESGRLGWLLLAAAVVGLGFNVKMLEAFLVLPALHLVYLVAAPDHWPARVLHLGGATAVLLVVALSWAVAVDLTPASERPFVGSTEHNSVLELIVWHNGLSRVLPGQTLFGRPGQPGAGPPAGAPGGAAGRAAGRAGPGGGVGAAGPGFEAGEGPFGGFGIGPPGPLRLLDRQLAGQIGWLLLLAFLSLVVVAWEGRRQPRRARSRQALLLWGTWLVTVTAFFSATRQFQAYYLVMLAPAVAALAGIGVAALWRAYRAGGRLGWLLPLILLDAALVQVWFLANVPDWGGWLTPWILGASLGSTAVLLAARRLRGPRWPTRPLAELATAVAVLALLVGPAVWSGLAAWNGTGARPFAGPSAFARARGGTPSPETGAASYLTAQRGSATYLAATLNANTAAPLILATGEPVMALGGFSGGDPILTPDQLAERIADGAVRYALLPSPTERPDGAAWLGRGRQTELAEWVQEHCAVVPGAAWQAPDAEQPPTDEATGPTSAAGPAGRRRGGLGSPGRLALFDCAAAAAAVPSSD